MQTRALDCHSGDRSFSQNRPGQREASPHHQVKAEADHSWSLHGLAENGWRNIQTATNSQLPRSVVIGVGSGLLARTMIGADSRISIALAAGVGLLALQGEPSMDRYKQILTDEERQAGVLEKRALGKSIRDYIRFAGPVTKADLERIVPISQLNPHKGILNGITIRVDQPGEGKIRVSLREAKIDRHQNEHGETRSFVRSLNKDLSDKFSVKSPNFCKRSHLFDSVTLMRADVTRAIQKISGNAPLTEPAISGDNFHVDGLDLSAKNLQPGDILKVGEALLFVTHNPHYACKQFENRFGELGYDFINSEAEFTVPEIAYNQKTFTDITGLEAIENQVAESDNYPKIAVERLGVFHRLRGIRLAVLETGHVALGDPVKVYRLDDGLFRYNDGEVEEILPITDEQLFYMSRLLDGVLMGSERAVRDEDALDRPHFNSFEYATNVHQKQRSNRERNQHLIDSGKRRNNGADPK